MYFMALWSVLRPFSKFYGHLENLGNVWYIFPPFWYVEQKKFWQHCTGDAAGVEFGPRDLYCVGWLFGRVT
jgi:hypothetical protein